MVRLYPALVLNNAGIEYNRTLYNDTHHIILHGEQGIHKSYTSILILVSLNEIYSYLYFLLVFNLKF